jgi:hypothetical protein
MYLSHVILFICLLCLILSSFFCIFALQTGLFQFNFIQIHKFFILHVQNGYGNPLMNLHCSYIFPNLSSLYMSIVIAYRSFSLFI